MQHIFAIPPHFPTRSVARARGARDERGRRVRDHEVRGEQRLQRSMQRGGRACPAARCRRATEKRGGATRAGGNGGAGRRYGAGDGQLLPGLKRREVGVRIELLDLDDRDPEAGGDARERVAGLDDVDLRLARARGLGARRGARSRAGLGARRRRLARLGRLRGRLARLRRRRVAGRPAADDARLEGERDDDDDGDEQGDRGGDAGPGLRRPRCRGDARAAAATRRRRRAGAEAGGGEAEADGGVSPLARASRRSSERRASSGSPVRSGSESPSGPTAPAGAAPASSSPQISSSSVMPAAPAPGAGSRRRPPRRDGSPPRPPARRR